MRVAGRSADVSRAALDRWRVHLPTVDETCVRVSCEAGSSGAPWPLARALTELRQRGFVLTERFRSLGAGRGQPLLHAQRGEWRGLAVHCEARTDRAGTVEAAMALPSMDEITDAGIDEAAWWELVDGFCAGVDAVHGALVDGEALDLAAPADAAGWRRHLGDHLGLLVPDRLDMAWGAQAGVYAALPQSRLIVVLR